MKIKREDGTVRYYYYKKKRGRPKKRGPKKKHVPKPRNTWQKPCDYRVVLCRDMKQIGNGKAYRTLREAYDFRKKVEEENDKVQIPVVYSNYKEIREVRNEYIILRRSEGNPETTDMRNDYGRIETYESSSEKWNIVDRFPVLFEERFYVYGTDERPTFDEICGSFVPDSPEDVIQVFAYNNKIVFKYGSDDIELVICKNTSDAIRFYNKMCERYRKIKAVVMSGFTSGKGVKTDMLFRLIKDKTGWTDKRIHRASTRA